MKQVVYRDLVLSKGSTALELWEAWQKETKDRNAAQKKLDQHMKDVEQRAKDIMERYK
jgi:DNA anti-recombination protein RmuC